MYMPITSANASRFFVSRILPQMRLQIPIGENLYKKGEKAAKRKLEAMKL